MCLITDTIPDLIINIMRIFAFYKNHTTHRILASTAFRLQLTTCRKGEKKLFASARFTASVEKFVHFTWWAINVVTFVCESWRWWLRKCTHNWRFWLLAFTETWIEEAVKKRWSHCNTATQSGIRINWKGHPLQKLASKRLSCKRTGNVSVMYTY